MHHWNEGDAVDWAGIDAAAAYIGENCARWGRINVSQYKEKYGTVRVYCSFGWWNLFSVIRPGWHFYRGFWAWTCRIPMSWANRLVVPIQEHVYRYFYKKAVQKWPHLTAEILSAADWNELLHGLGYEYQRDEEEIT